VHPSLLPDQTLLTVEVDYVICGEGEKVIVDLLKEIERDPSGRTVKNMWASEKFLSLDDVPEPDYSLVDINKYFMNLYQSKKTLSLLTGKGCPHGCKYCYNVEFNNRKWRGLSAENIVKRVKTLISFGAESIDLLDDNFFVDKNRVKDFCELLLKEKINMSFMTNCRADYIAGFSDEFLSMIKHAGFNELFIGVESGSQRVLDYIHKDLTIEQVRTCNAKLKRAGIKPIYSFMCGFPTETEEEVFSTLDLMMELLEEYPGAAVTSLKVFTPFPGSELFSVCVKNGFVPPTSLEGWGRFNYNTVQFKKDKLLERLSLITYFLDPKTLEGISNNELLRFCIRLYGRVVWWRCKHKFFGFMPETKVIKWVKNR